MKTVRTGSDQRRAIENGIDEILRDGVVLLADASIIRHLDIPNVWLGESGLARLAELNHRRFIAREADLIIFQNELSAFADDFEPVRPRRFARGSDEHARR